MSFKESTGINTKNHPQLNLEAIPGAILVFNSSCQLIGHNSEALAFLRTLGIDLRDFQSNNHPLLNLKIKRKQQTVAFGSLLSQLAGRSDERFIEKVSLVANDGKTVKPMLLTAKFNEAESSAENIVIQLSAWVETRPDLSKQPQQLEVLDHLSEATLVTDRFFNVIGFNKAYCDITQLSPEEVWMRKIRLKRLLKNEPENYRSIRRELVTEGFWQGELTYVRKNGERFPISLSVRQVMSEEGGVSHYIIVFSDITELKIARQRLDFLAYHDQLTHLPNRALSQIRYLHSCERAARQSTKVAVLFIDLDNFKLVNDSLGHNKGDALLKQFASRLQSVTRGQDTVSRLSGDEFLILLEDVAKVEQITCVAEKILNQLEIPFQLGEQERYVGACIGIAVYPDDGKSFDELTRNANTAMHTAKQTEKHNYTFYKAEFSHRAIRRSQLEHDLRSALVQNAFHLHYQPQFDLNHGVVSGAEALLRWNHPSGEFISPAEFIPIIEASGLIVPIGRWVAKEALMALKRWRNEGLDLPRVAINLSGIQLQKDDFEAYIDQLLPELSLQPEDLEIEITESIFVENEASSKVIEALHRKGIFMALDDFGTGYSSLAYLTRLSFDKIKLDRSFIGDIEQNDSSKSMVRSLVALAQTLGFEVIAEGVENQAQLELLMHYGCDEAQGYFIGRPVPEDNFMAQVSEFYAQFRQLKQKSFA